MTPSFLGKMLQLAAQVRDPVTAAVFALAVACIAFWIAFRKKDKKTVLTLGVLLGVGIIFLGALPLLSRTYLNTHGAYEVRIMVLGTDHSPVEKAAVICSPGGEQKPIAGGVECDILPRNRPADGLFTAYAAVKSAFLAGSGQLHLADDYNPVLTIDLKPESSSAVQGEVQDEKGHVLPGAWISVVGHESERVQTGAGGGFVLSAHAANGQMIKLHAEAAGYQAYEGLQQAGDTSISVKLTR